jgi:hypothetical protein
MNELQGGIWYRVDLSREDIRFIKPLHGNALQTSGGIATSCAHVYSPTKVDAHHIFYPMTRYIYTKLGQEEAEQKEEMLTKEKSQNEKYSYVYGVFSC